jgi:hypothetical protein
MKRRFSPASWCSQVTLPDSEARGAGFMGRDCASGSSHHQVLFNAKLMWIHQRAL